MAPTDIIIDSAGDDIHQDGDWLVEDSTMQHQQELIETDKGVIKHQPIGTVGISDYILDESDGSELKAEIQSQFEDDGMIFERLIVNGLLDIRLAAYYAKN